MGNFFRKKWERNSRRTLGKRRAQALQRTKADASCLRSSSREHSPEGSVGAKEFAYTCATQKIIDEEHS